MYGVSPLRRFAPDAAQDQELVRRQNEDQVSLVSLGFRPVGTSPLVHLSHSVAVCVDRVDDVILGGRLVVVSEAVPVDDHLKPVRAPTNGNIAVVEYQNRVNLGRMALHIHPFVDIHTLPRRES